MKTRVLLIIAAILILPFSCKKDTSPAIDNDSLNAVSNEVIADIVYDDVFNTADYAAIILDHSGPVAKSLTVISDSCPVLTITRPTANLWPKLITVDYGASCTGIGNYVRSGKILIEVTGPRLETGSRRTITFEDYYFNNIKVEGTKIIENMGLNSNQNPVFSVRLSGGKLTLAGGSTIERTTDFMREISAGLLTKTIWDDECLITGTAYGKSASGVFYNSTIMTALHWARSCRYLVSGVIKIERDGLDPVTVDFGNDDCDSKVTVTMGGISNEIQL